MSRLGLGVMVRVRVLHRAMMLKIVPEEQAVRGVDGWGDGWMDG